MEYIWHYETKLGPVTLASDGVSLSGLWFDGQKYYARGLDEERVEAQLSVFERTVEWLDAYFKGEKPAVDIPLAPKGTDFQKEVWDILLTIPYGQTTTYGEIADRIAARRGIAHMSAQAVGGAVGHNPISLIIPCHRVIGADGKMTGYAGGIEKKIWLLEQEQQPDKA